MRVIIKVGRSCNNHCTFCHASDRRRGFEPKSIVESKIRRALSLDASMVILSGGEPTLHPDLISFASQIAALGMDLGLITNGRLLANTNLVQELLRRNLRYAYVSLHGSRSALHDSIVRSKAFDDTLFAIQTMAGDVAELTVNTVVIKQNLTDLRNLVDLLRTLPDLRIKFTFPQPKGAVLDDFSNIVAPLSEAANAVSEAIAHGTAFLPLSRFGLEGFPACVVPGLHSLRNDLTTNDIRFLSEPEDEDLVAVDSALSTMTPRCEGCRLRDDCPGIFRGYLERLGDGELAPILDDVPVAPRKVSSSFLREQAATQHRHWVRLTYACNNRCRFCLDRESNRSDARRVEVIKEEIVQGRRQGAERLILSGGEPTTHPRFSALVRFGKRVGYRWVQAISNGRMFSYPRFLAEAITAGLDELTVSMHGHTAALHDPLVGVPGAFEQASRAIRSAVESRKLVVNIDIVINAYNIDLLPDMLETFVAWGVREFDLLHLIPFGGAWEPEQQDLFYDLNHHAPSLRRALHFSQTEGVQLWLNRFPPQHAEGFEFLIQDPHKLHDEVRGRQQAFEHFVGGGPHLPCRSPERCVRCYLQELCDTFERMRSLARADRVSKLRVIAPLSYRPPLPRTDLLEIIAESTKVAVEALETREALQASALRLRLHDMEGLVNHLHDGCVGGIRLKEIVVDHPRKLEQALACHVDVVIELNRKVARILRSLEPHAHRLVFEQPTYDRFTRAAEADVSLPDLFAELGYTVRTRGIAPCLSGVEPLPSPKVLDVSVLRDDGTIDPQSLTSLFARELFFVRSLRCRECACFDSCPGMHLNWVRVHGFAQFDPSRFPRR